MKYIDYQNALSQKYRWMKEDYPLTYFVFQRQYEASHEPGFNMSLRETTSSRLLMSQQINKLRDRRLGWLLVLPILRFTSKFNYKLKPSAFIKIGRFPSASSAILTGLKNLGIVSIHSRLIFRFLKGVFDIELLSDWIFPRQQLVELQKRLESQPWERLSYGVLADIESMLEKQIQVTTDILDFLNISMIVSQRNTSLKWRILIESARRSKIPFIEIAHGAVCVRPTLHNRPFWPHTFLPVAGDLLVLWTPDQLKLFRRNSSSQEHHRLAFLGWPKHRVKMRNMQTKRILVFPTSLFVGRQNKKSKMLKKSLCSFTEEVVSKLVCQNFNVQLRLHPADKGTELSGKLKFMFDRGDFDLVNGDLSKEISEASAVVGISWSSSLIESSVLGVPTFFLSPRYMNLELEGVKEISFVELDNLHLLIKDWKVHDFGPSMHDICEDTNFLVNFLLNVKVRPSVIFGGD